LADTPPATPRTGAVLRAYLLAVRAAGPFLPTYLRRRLKRGREDPDRWREKLGEASLPRPDGPLIWMHAVGLGEVMALRGLIAAMGRARPDLSFLVTSSARSSAQAFAGNTPPRTQHQFLPLDAPGPVAAFLDHWRPDLSIWAEQDLWPGLVVATHRRGIPLALINARMNARAFAARSRFRGLYADLYARFAHISVQDAGTAKHLAALGAPAPLVVTGSLKAGAGPLADQPDLRAALAAVLGGRKPWCVASSHAADEDVALAAHKAVLDQVPARLLIIAPRDPTRRSDIIAACAAAGLSVALRSVGVMPAPTDAVYLADTFGEMGLWYRLCPVALVGGSMGDTGGHNPWEPAHLGCAVLHGPNVANFAADYDAFHIAGAARLVADATQLVQTLQDTHLPEQAARGLALAQGGMAGLDALCAQLLALTPQVPHG
jgi:3-deoxy-D-manno-octulosonic-acid transferase